MKLVFHQQSARRKRISRKRELRRRRYRISGHHLQLDPKQRYVSSVTIWDGGDVEEAICTRRPFLVPSVLCLEINQRGTLEFIELIRSKMEENFRRGGRDFVKRRAGRIPVIEGYADFSRVEYMSTSAAIMLAAEYDRIRCRINKVPPTVNLSEWSDGAFKPLFDIGFFDLVGISDDLGEKIISASDTRTMKIVPMGLGENKMPVVDQYLDELYRYIFPTNQRIPSDITDLVLTSVSEAISNVTEHAYDMTFRYPIPPVGRAWVTASASKSDRSLSVVVYDQGAGIPYTYPKKHLTSAAKEFIMQKITAMIGRESQSFYDDTYIEAAMQYGNSRTGLPYRGKGLPQMNELVARLGSGKMCVYSGRGWWMNDGQGNINSGITAYPVGGTLIEWTLRFPQETSDAL